MTTWNMFSFQDPNSFSALLLIWLHDYNMMILLSTMMLISYYIIISVFELYTVRFLLHGNFLEMMWTILPMLVLFDMAIPSLQILYFMENFQVFVYSFKTIGHQWYWSYEFFLKGSSFYFDSYMLSLSDLIKGEYRLLDVDNRLVLPLEYSIRNIVTSVDVIHSWALPSLGVKIDAIPGRLNQVILYPLRSGLYYGQCSEICGMNHSFMPIVLEVTNLKNFFEWMIDWVHECNFV